MCSGGCGGSRVSAPMSTPSTNLVRVNIAPVENCPYTIEQLTTWRTKLICCKDKSLYVTLGINAQTMNRYLGAVMSAMANPSNPCYYQALLDQVSAFMVILTQNGTC